MCKVGFPAVRFSVTIYWISEACIASLQKTTPGNSLNVRRHCGRMRHTYAEWSGLSWATHVVSFDFKSFFFPFSVSAFVPRIFLLILGKLCLFPY